MNQIFINILKTSFYGSFFILAGFFVNYIFKDKFKAKWHYLIWIIIILRFMFPVFFEIKNTPNNIPLYNTVSRISKVVDKIPAELFNNPQTNELIQVSENEEINKSLTKINEITKKSNFSSLNISFYNIWFIICLLILAINTFKYFNFKNSIVKTKESISQQQNNLKKSIMKDLKIKSNINVFISEKAVIPFVIGVFSPTIFIGKEYFSNEQLKFILTHELVHVKRKDALTKWIFFIVRSIYWFNPLLYFASKQIDYFCEISCDDIVLENKSNDEKVEYGLTLLNVMKQSFYKNNNLLVSMNSNKKNVYKRIKNMMVGKTYKKSLFYIVPTFLLIIFMSACSSVKLKDNQIQNLITTEPLIKIKTEENLTDKVILITGNVDDSANIKDTIMLAKLDVSNKEIKLTSIPRDTYIEFSDDELSNLRKINKSIPKNMKLSSFTNYLDGNGENVLLKDKVSKILGIQIDYYLDLDTKVFRNLVDDLGGVEMVVPQGGFYYSDPIQNLTINLQEGGQILDGNRAEQFVRFRSGYAEGDLKRIEMQKYFIKQVFTKLLEDKSTFTKINLILNNIVNETKTNISLSDLLSYYNFVSTFSNENLKFYNLPITIGTVDGQNYVFLEDIGVKNLIKNEFRGN